MDITSESSSSSDDYFSEEDFLSESENEDSSDQWQEVSGRTSMYTEYSEDDQFLKNQVNCNDPLALFKMFFTDYIIDIIVKETNQYAQQNITSSIDGRRHQQAWQSVTRNEVNKFFALLLIMGLVRLPEIRLYWSRNKFYQNRSIITIMERDRFLAILKFLHFSNNATARYGDRLSKLQEIVEAIVATFKDTVRPGKNIVVDETMVPWRGRLGFRQYIPGKRHKYGIKIYKLCVPDGYTYNLEIYAGKTQINTQKSRTHDIIKRLLQGLSNEGRILFVDSFYTNVHLAEDLLMDRTFLCGTVKINKKCLPSQARQKQKKGQIISFENRNGVKFLKWTDKRAVCMVSTVKHHTCKLMQAPRGRLKPDAILDYNNAKKGVDLSDQLSAYYSSLRKTVKWYRKIVIQLICGTSIVNAWYIHKKWGTQNMTILKFREAIINGLLGNQAVEKENRFRQKHVLKERGTNAKDVRKRCKECYRNFAKSRGRDYATKHSKKVKTFCGHCDGRPALCLQCFNKVHKSI